MRVHLGTACNPVSAAEREDVRKVINLVTSVKMPYPETLTRNRAKTERVWLERGGTTTGCIRLEDRRWCYEYIPPEGNRAEMLRIRNEPSRDSDPPLSKDTPQHLDSAYVERAKRDVALQLSRAGRGAQ